MSIWDQNAPSPFLLEPSYWRDRLQALNTQKTGLLILPREDLSTPLSHIDELRVRAHDGIRLWGLRGRSPFHPETSSATIHLVEAFERPEIFTESVASGCADFVFQVPAGRRLEDRVLDVLRLRQVVAETCGLDPSDIEMVAKGPAEERDEFMIVDKLAQVGLG